MLAFYPGSFSHLDSLPAVLVSFFLENLSVRKEIFLDSVSSVTVYLNILFALASFELFELFIQKSRLASMNDYQSPSYLHTIFECF